MGRQLIAAAKTGDLQSVRYFLNRGVNVHSDDDAALRCASSRGFIEIVKCLLEHDVDVNALDGEAIRYAAWNDHFKIVQLLLDHGADLHVENNSPIIDAYRKNNTDMVNLLLSYYRPQKDDSAFTAMIIINNFELTRQYNKRLSCMVKYEFLYDIQIRKRISKYIIRNTVINNEKIAMAIYSTNYHIHRTKVSEPTNQLLKQYKN